MPHVQVLARKFLFISLVVPGAFAQLREQPTPPSPTGVQTDYIVGFREGVMAAQRIAAIARTGAEVRSDLGIVNAVAVHVPNINALAAIQREVAVVSIRPDLPVHATAKPGGGGGRREWAGGT